MNFLLKFDLFDSRATNEFNNLLNEFSRIYELKFKSRNLFYQSDALNYEWMGMIVLSSSLDKKFIRFPGQRTKSVPENPPRSIFRTRCRALRLLLPFVGPSSVNRKCESVRSFAITSWSVAEGFPYRMFSRMDVANRIGSWLMNPMARPRSHEGSSDRISWPSTVIWPLCTS